jgi:hypothetical protein
MGRARRRRVAAPPAEEERPLPPLESPAAVWAMIRPEPVLDQDYEREAAPPVPEPRDDPPAFREAMAHVAPPLPASRGPLHPWQRYGTPTATFLIVLGAGFWMRDRIAPVVAAAPTSRTPLPRLDVPRVATSVTPQTREQLDRLREATLVIDQLGEQLGQAKAFYDAYPLDRVLSLHLEALNPEQLGVIEHFCDRQLFTLDREARLLAAQHQMERKSDAVFASPPPAGGLLQHRLEAALETRAARIADLRRALALYQRERGTEITVPDAADTLALATLRENVRTKLVAQRQRAAELDTQIAAAEKAARE